MSIILAAVALAAPVASRANETYRFDQSRSTIGFTVHQFLGACRGQFRKFNGKIEIDPEHPETSSVTARIDVNSIDTGIATRDSHLRSSELFNTEKFPDITFKSRSVKQTGAQAADIVGDFSMHGVTRPVTLHVQLASPAKDNNRTRWKVSSEPIQRRDFDLLFSPTAETMSGISQVVQVSIEIEAARAP